MVERNLDGCYFRIMRDGRWVNSCFTDLTKDEREELMIGKSENWFRVLACHLADRLREIGDELDLECE